MIFLIMRCLWDFYGAPMGCIVFPQEFNEISLGFPFGSYEISMGFLWDFFGLKENESKVK